MPRRQPLTTGDDLLHTVEHVYVLIDEHVEQTGAEEHGVDAVLTHVVPQHLRGEVRFAHNHGRSTVEQHRPQFKRETVPWQRRRERHHGPFVETRERTRMEKPDCAAMRGDHYLRSPSRP